MTAFKGDFSPDPSRLMAEIERKVKRAEEDAVEMLAFDVWGNIGEGAPKDHGRLAGGFDIDRFGPLAWKIGTAVEYAEWVHEGTGLFGPGKKPIRPKNAKVLRFEIDGKTIFARSVRGQKPNRYVDRAIDKSENRTNEFVRTSLQRAGLI